MSRQSVKFAAVLAGGLISAATWLAGCASADKKPAPELPSADGRKAEHVSASPAERGKYLVTVMSCNDCHTPFHMTPRGPEPDMARMLSGHPQDFKLPPPPDLGKGPWVWAGAATNTAFAGPWGISYAANLTPDKVSGLASGGWSEERFIKAMRTGKHFGESRPILPPMPWQGLSQATDADLKAIWAYLQTVPPIHNEVPTVVMAGGPPPAGK